MSRDTIRIDMGKIVRHEPDVGDLGTLCIGLDKPSFRDTDDKYAKDDGTRRFNIHFSLDKTGLCTTLDSVEYSAYRGPKEEETAREETERRYRAILQKFHDGKYEIHFHCSNRWIEVKFTD